RLTRSCRLRARSLAILAVLPLQVVPAHATPALVVANWNDYINPDLITRFTQETGIQVDYRTFETDEDADALLRQEFPPDVLVPDSYYLPRLIQEGLLQPVAARSLPVYEDIDPLILSRLSHVDPGRRYAIPYMWGRVGIVMDRERVEQALGAQAPNSWGLLFDPSQLARLSSCGASLLDARAEFFALWMNWHGALAERPAGREMRAFHKALVELRPHLQAVDNLAYLDDMPEGRQCIAMAWEGDARAMIGENPNLEFLIPDEGSTVYVDALVVPAKSRMPEQAWRFIEFMSQPEIAYLNAEHVQYNSPYKTVTRRLLLSKEGQAGWRSLRAGGAGKAVSLVIGEGSRRPTVIEAWATFVGQREEGLAVGARQ
ncbi:MAG TPA: extracellular solute-binding protein, partial [Pseudomonas sp.]|nr:extracellular solute-binding protein [Pseudomonas sp.]